jgi:hypothetical protein
MPPMTGNLQVPLGGHLTSDKTNMGVSGQHNGNAWDFIQCAVTVTHLKSVTHLAVYYFWMRCEHQPGIDESFQQFLDPEIKGSTIDIGNVDLPKSDLGLQEKKHKSNSEFAEMTSHLTSLMSAQEARSKTMEQLMTAKEERKRAGGAGGAAGTTCQLIVLLGGQGESGYDIGRQG